MNNNTANGIDINTVRDEHTLLAHCNVEMWMSSDILSNVRLGSQEESLPKHFTWRSRALITLQVQHYRLFANGIFIKPTATC
jgi:hypothetical protein